MLNAMRLAATQIKKDFRKTTETWKHQPKFEDEISLTGPGPILTVFTEDEIYGYVSGGTRPHEIWAGIYTGKSDKKQLSFVWGGKGSYKAKTKPGVIGSSKGGATGSLTHRAYVQHPGTEARKFEETIQKKRQKWFKREMEKAMKVAAQKSGYGE
jgi:hypothetical protein